MKKALVFPLFCALVFIHAWLVSAGGKAPREVVDLANSKLVKVGTDPVIVAAVKAENAKGKTLSQIQTMDKKWRATTGLASYMKALMTSKCGEHLKKIQAGQPFYTEIFVVDNQGANVAMADKTSGYWQGDEANFKESYKGGAGAVYLSNVKFDDSTQADLVQVSVPVKDSGKVIGVITFGIDIDRVIN